MLGRHSVFKTKKFRDAQKFNIRRTFRVRHKRLELGREM
jgi:hypothetical protein